MSDPTNAQKTPAKSSEPQTSRRHTVIKDGPTHFEHPSVERQLARLAVRLLMSKRTRVNERTPS